MDAIKKALKIAAAYKPTTNEKRVLFEAKGPGGVKGIVVPKYMWDGYKGSTGGHQEGMRERNAARAKVYGSENRDPLSIPQVGKIHKETLDQHFALPLKQQLEQEKAALNRLREARHISDGANTLDESEKTDTVKFEPDPYVPVTSKGVAGHALYTSGHGANEKRLVINTCPAQTKGCSGGIDPVTGVVDTSHGTCFAPNAEYQYGGASIRRACHEQAKHDPAMTRDWILAHAGSLRSASNSADKKGLKTMFRPNVVDETDVSSRHVINHLNKQRVAAGLPKIIANSYGKTSELHDPENGYHVTFSNIGPKTKHGASIAENVKRDFHRKRQTITATDGEGRDFRNEQGNLTPPKNSYLVNNVKRYSALDDSIKKAVTHVKYWGSGRANLTPKEEAEGPEGHFDGDGKPTSPDLAHYGHTTVGGRRYDYQKQHVLHPREVDVPVTEDGVTTIKKTYTDSRFKDNDFLPHAHQRFKTKNGKLAGAIVMTTPTESTSNAGHHTAFTHHIDEHHVERARANHGEYEIDNPHEQEATFGKEYEPTSGKQGFASGGAVYGGDEVEGWGLPEQSSAAQAHLAHRRDGEPVGAGAPEGLERALMLARRVGVL